MRSGVIQSNRIASLFVDTCFDLLADTQLPAAQPANVDMSSVALDGVLHLECSAGAVQRAAVADLSTALSVEWRGIQDDLAFLSGTQHFQLLITPEQPHHRALVLDTLVPAEVGAVGDGNSAAHAHAELTGSLALAALLVHCGIESGLVNGQVTLTRNVRSQIDRKPIGIVETEDCLAWNDAAAQARYRTLQQRHTAAERLRKALLFLCED